MCRFTSLDGAMPSKQIEDHYEFHRNRDEVTKPEGTPEVGHGEKPSSSPVVGDIRSRFKREWVLALPVHRYDATCRLQNSARKNATS